MRTTGDLAGVLTASAGATSFAWAGVRVTAAVDLGDVRRFSDLGAAERLTAAVAEQAHFLSAEHDPSGTPLELRWSWDPSVGRLSCVLLTRVQAPAESQARLLAAASAARLAASLPHCHARVLSDEELPGALQPFAPHPSGAAEIRKRVHIGHPNRPDAGVAYYLAVQPFGSEPVTWDGLLQQLTAHPFPVVVSVGVAGQHLHHAVAESISEVGTNFARLATDAEHLAGTLYRGKAKLTADAFAVDAKEVYADAARRYGGPTFRLRVSCLSPAPLPPSLLSALGSVVAGAGALSRGSGASFLSSATVAAAYEVVRPSSAAELSAFSYDIGSLSFSRWGEHPVWVGSRDLPPAPSALRPLCYTVDAAEATNAFRLPLAVYGTVPGFSVRAGVPAVTTDYVPAGPALLLGRQEATGGAPLAVELSMLPSHTLVLGTTNSGKTNTTLSLCRQLWADHGIPFLVIEPVNADRDDYRWLATLPGFEDMLVLTVGDEAVAPLRLNPFEVPAGVRVGQHAANLRACFDAAFGLWDPLPAIYQRALRRTYETAGYALEETATGEEPAWPVLADFNTALSEVLDGADGSRGLDYAGEVRSNIVAASTLRAESLAEGPCASTLSGARSFPIADLLARPVVIELAGVGDDQKEQSLITALLLNTMTEHYKAVRTGSALAHVTVIEEAHRLLGKPPSSTGDSKEGNAATRAAEAFANTLAENRKYGEGLVIVDQDPDKLVPDAYKNTNTKLMHRLPSDADRALIGQTMRFSEDQEAYASALPKMTAFAYHAALDRPALVEVDDVRAIDARRLGLPLAPLADAELLRKRHAAFLAQVPQAAEAMRPQAACGHCAVRCVYGPAAARADAAHVPAITELLQSWPRSGPREQWWAQMLQLLDSAGEPVRPARAPAGDTHWRCAVLRALLTKAYTGDTSAWVPALLTHLRSVPEAPQP